ncbi:STAS domain-containing protein [Nocardioides sp. CER19]|uniref:STAS domain-containing protein n=1 Tax=Nocardioides sp. CER19 TaxID=3038538 RepID=UPI002449E31E|nr:STAS domain-containing protein [Nocardioides sp. CER19]MDH2413748.1 STAS domain-containing protein [Nocardioides sp. CER19]
MEVSTQGATLRLAGQLDARCTSQVREALAVHIATHGATEDVVVDMSGVTGADLIALKMLAAASWRATSAGKHLVLCDCAPGVKRLLHLSHLMKLLDVEDHGTGQRSA